MSNYDQQYHATFPTTQLRLERMEARLIEIQKMLLDQQELNNKLLRHPQIQALLNTLDATDEPCNGVCDECDVSCDDDCWE